MGNLESTIRWCDDIGMFAYDRPIPVSCVHRTDYCEAHCFNVKLYRIYPAMRTKDERNEAYWQQITGGQVAATLARKRKFTGRVRFMTRGEAVSDHSDIARIVDICNANPDVDFWMPTRSWRNPLLMARVESELRTLPNLHVLASFDPSNTAEEWEAVRAMGWSTMFFGDDDMLTTPLGDRMFKCPKTHGHVAGACAKCKRGCFEGHGRVDVHLAAH